MTVIFNEDSLIPGYAGGSLMQPKERKYLVDTLPHDAIVLEIGSWSGTTAAWLCDQRPDIKMVCVDPLVNSYGNRVCTEEMHQIVLQAWFQNKRAAMSLWLGTVDDLLSFFRTKFDAVIVDGNHKEENVYHDLELGSSVTRLMFAHDYADYPSPVDTVHRAVDQFCRDHGWQITDRICISAKLEPLT